MRLVVRVLKVGDAGFDVEALAEDAAVLDGVAVGFTFSSSSVSVSDSSLVVSSSLLDSGSLALGLGSATGLDWWLGRNRL